MVKAILEGRKTQTRRPVAYLWDIDIHLPDRRSFPGHFCFSHNRGYGRKDIFHKKSPFGQPGDRLWVRETFRIVGWYEGEPYLIEYKADGKCIREPGDSSVYDEDKYLQYAIDCANECANAGMELDEDDLYVLDDYENPIKWRPSIHMPRWASRLTLEVKRVWVERLKDISEDDANSEGFKTKWTCINPAAGSYAIDVYAVEQFIEHWDKIYGKKYPSSSNPWVWACEFEAAK